MVGGSVGRSPRRPAAGLAAGLAAGFAVAALGLPARVASAETLTVDLSATIRGVTHAASGSLYGVTETLPADVNGLIAPLHPYVERGLFLPDDLGAVERGKRGPLHPSPARRVASGEAPIRKSHRPRSNS